LGFGAEAIIFCYVGLALASYTSKKELNEVISKVCWPFVICEMFIVVFGRFLAVYLSYYIFFCKKSDTVSLSFRELTFIAYAAVIRGAIAFGLVTSISDDIEFPHKEIIQASMLMLVILTTVIFGTFTSLVGKFLLPE